MLDFLLSYIDFFGIFRPHIWSVIVLIVTFFFSFFLLSYKLKIPIFYQFIISLTFCSLGMNFYEAMHACFYWKTFPFVMWIPPLAIIFILLLENYFFHFLNFNWIFTIMSVMMIASMFLLLNENFFENLRLLQIGLVPDPHGIVWMISKALGFWMFLPLIKIKQVNKHKK